MGKQYRAKALEFLALAQNQVDGNLRSQYESLAAAYMRLAEQADRNDFPLIVEFELPPKSDEPQSEK